METTDHSKASCSFTSFDTRGHMARTICFLLILLFLFKRESSVSFIVGLPLWLQETTRLNVSNVPLFASLMITYRNQTTAVLYKRSLILQND